MSDYLWDKKGEPDADVARLETLLGAFKHAPRALELPAEPATPEPRPATLLPFAPRPRASRLFAPAALAAAAALVVASVLVASAFLRARVADRDERAAAPAPSRPNGEASKGERAEPREVVRRMLEPPPPAVETKGGRPLNKVEDERAAVESLPRGGRRRNDVRTAVAARQRQKVLGADAFKDGPGAGEGLTLEATRAGFSASAFVENTRLLTKEQLVYALRLTGAKLRDVREKAQGSKAEDRPLQ